MFIHYMKKYMAIIFIQIKIGENSYKFTFLIFVAPLEITNLNLGTMRFHQSNTKPIRVSPGLNIIYNKDTGSLSDLNEFPNPTGWLSITYPSTLVNNCSIFQHLANTGPSKPRSWRIRV